MKIIAFDVASEAVRETLACPGAAVSPPRMTPARGLPLSVAAQAGLGVSGFQRFFLTPVVVESRVRTMVLQPGLEGALPVASVPS
mgnify:FL=1